MGSIGSTVRPTVKYISVSKHEFPSRRLLLEHCCSRIQGSSSSQSGFQLVSCCSGSCWCTCICLNSPNFKFLYKNSSDGSRITPYMTSLQTFGCQLSQTYGNHNIMDTSSDQRSLETTGTEIWRSFWIFWICWMSRLTTDYELHPL